jgi:acetylornithine deacetylase/succinyl-diaminopimelate desuccinylase-like protein
MDQASLLKSVSETEVVRFCQELVRIKSVNPPGDELPAAEYVASILEKAGLEVNLIPGKSAKVVFF